MYTETDKNILVTDIPLKNYDKQKTGKCKPKKRIKGLRDMSSLSFAIALLSLLCFLRRELILFAAMRWYSVQQWAHSYYAVVSLLCSSSR